MMMTYRRLVFLLAAVGALSGCSIRGSIEDLSKSAITSLMGEQRGLTSGAIAHETVQGYNVSSSLGSYTGSIIQSQNGYTVYVGLQGSATSEIEQAGE